ncbi:adenosylcobinamide-GDP ribazoletransferase [Acinetobacter kanungonis]|uniref:adenosylcobinamide-GDP ribazoletransferase n=1 Tax=Acinetobacter kanungonis TaxID=2699469 RepID=UPI00137A0C28|nr:adenosylcobinamide-GDP ribazoletransferase [Acinetobacter kanungonis]NCI79114.1 adenosylcobinamide-GDP ribazoletransferase [Acinetobacter kanungonis]
MTPFLIALQFLTTLRVQLKEMPTSQQNANSILFYPVVGLIIGLILYIVALLLSGLPTVLLSSLILVLWIWLTGGLHLDGLADTADAWVGGFGDKERTLKIMKDPSCGPIGVLSLIIVCVLKWAALYVLLEEKAALALLLFPVLGRTIALGLFVSTPYVRSNGLGSSIAAHLPKRRVYWVIGLSLSLVMYFLGLGLLTGLAWVLAFIYLRTKFLQRLGGITGDTIGASIELSETVCLLAFVIGLSYLPIGTLF